MRDSHRYVMLLSSLPYHGPLFSARVTPLSRIRLQERLSLLDAEDLAEVDAMAGLLDWYRHPVQKTDEEIVRLAKRTIPQLRSSFARELLTWRLEMRTLIAALRRRRDGRDISSEEHEWGYGRWLTQIRKYWNEPCFRLEGVHPWLPEAARFMEMGDPVALERHMLETVWNYLQRMEDGHVFDYERVLIYLFRWDLVGRWTVADAEVAESRYTALIEDGLEDINHVMRSALSGRGNPE